MIAIQIFKATLMLSSSPEKILIFYNDIAILATLRLNYLDCYNLFYFIIIITKPLTRCWYPWSEYGSDLQGTLLSVFLLLGSWLGCCSLCEWNVWFGFETRLCLLCLRPNPRAEENNTKRGNGVSRQRRRERTGVAHRGCWVSPQKRVPGTEPLPKANCG